MELYIDAELAILDTVLYMIEGGESGGAHRALAVLVSENDLIFVAEGPPSPASTVGATPPEENAAIVLGETEGDEGEEKLAQAQVWREQETPDELIFTPETEAKAKPEGIEEVKPVPMLVQEVAVAPEPPAAETIDLLAQEAQAVREPQEAPEAVSDLMALACTAGALSGTIDPPVAVAPPPVLPVAAPQSDPTVSEVTTGPLATTDITTAALPAESTWICGHCTTVNQDTIMKGGKMQPRVKCSMCQKNRAKSTSTSSSSSSSGAGDVKARRRQMTSMAEAVSTSQVQRAPSPAIEEAGEHAMDVTGEGDESGKSPAAVKSRLPMSCPPAPPPTPATPLDPKPAPAPRGKRGTKSKASNSSSSSSINSDVAPAPEPEPAAAPRGSRRPERKAKSKRAEAEDEGQEEGEEKEGRGPGKRGKVETRGSRKLTQENAPNIDEIAQDTRPANQAKSGQRLHALGFADATAPLRQREEAKAQAKGKGKGKAKVKGEGKAGEGMDVDVAASAADEDPEGADEKPAGKLSLQQHIRLYGKKHDITLT